MSFNGFTNEDFDLFKIDGLEQRMEALIKIVRPKLQYLGDYFAPSLSTLMGQEVFAHVAKHARRTKNPPKDTWVAFATNSRGYKMLPHFQIGLWESHVFILFAIIYESPNKGENGKKLIQNIEPIYSAIPDDFVWSTDHTKPESKLHNTLTQNELNSMFERLISVKSAEVLCGYHIPRSEAIALSSEEMVKKIQSVFEKLALLYKISSQ